jgi:small GTP-binding protein
MVNSLKKKNRAIKIIIAGNGAVGKTTISERLAGTIKDDEDREMTCGVEFHDLNVDSDSLLKGQLWDLGGQTQFRVFQIAFFKDVDLVILVYDVNMFQSYLELGNWIEMISNRKPMKAYLIANKIDLPQRVISTDDGFEFAQKHDLEYFEVSALTGLGFDTFKDQLFQDIKEIMNSLN